VDQIELADERSRIELTEFRMQEGFFKSDDARDDSVFFLVSHVEIPLSAAIRSTYRGQARTRAF
jgi:hypothetical protein